MKMDHRWGPRQATSIAVHVAASGATGAARMVNVSLTGAYLETSAPLRRHALVYLAPSSRHNCAGGSRRIAAYVIRHDVFGVGLEWCQPLTKGGHIALLLTMLADGEIEGTLVAA